MSQLNILAIVGSYRNEESYSYKTLKLIEERMNTLRDWLDANYYTDVPLNPMARLAVNFIAWRIRNARKKGKINPVR
jgi:hypothetical protein